MSNSNCQLPKAKRRRNRQLCGPDAQIGTPRDKPTRPSFAEFNIMSRTRRTLLSVVTYVGAKEGGESRSATKLNHHASLPSKLSHNSQSHSPVRGPVVRGTHAAIEHARTTASVPLFHRSLLTPLLYPRRAAFFLQPSRSTMMWTGTKHEQKHGFPYLRARTTSATLNEIRRSLPTAGSAAFR